jgi:hypothetical protein
VQAHLRVEVVPVGGVRLLDDDLAISANRGIIPAISFSPIPGDGPKPALCLQPLGPGLGHQHRAVATRFDERERIYQGTLDVASIRIWLRDPVT